MSNRWAGHPAPATLPVRQPTWDAPDNVAAVFTTRLGGESTGHWGDGQGGGGLNLGANCGDSSERVRNNRRRLEAHVGRPIRWLNQVHGNRVIETLAINRQPQAEEFEQGRRARENSDAALAESADAQVSTTPGVALGILVADCLPVLLADRGGTIIGAAHAGWRGLCAGVLETTVAAMRARISESGPAADLVAWLGPCIGPSAFEVGSDVLDAFGRDEVDTAALFEPAIKPDKWLADLAGLALWRLERLGVTSIAHAGGCTFTDRNDYWSYRRDGNCGRMAAVVWLKGTT